MSLTPIRAGTLARLIQDHHFFRQLGHQAWKQAEPGAMLQTVEDGQVVLEVEDMSPFAWFLVDGSVTLHDPDGQVRELEAGDVDAGYPIANLRPSRYTVRGRLQAKLVRLEQANLKRITSTPGPARFAGATEAGGGSWQSHRFAVEIARRLQAAEFVIPSMPGISARISAAMQQDDYDIEDIALIISAEPAIAGGLVNIANSALFKGHDTVDTLQRAVVRLGMTQTHSLVTTLATKALFATANPWLKPRLQQTWRHAVDMAAYATVLAGFCPKLDRSKALLLGLLHEIGTLPVLVVADDYSELAETPGVLDAVLANVVGQVSALTLRSWGLEDFAQAAPQQENWFYQHDGAVDYTDVLIVAHLHAMLKRRAYADLPRVDETPAYQQLSAFGLSARRSVEVLEEAQQQIAELRGLLA